MAGYVPGSARPPMERGGVLAAVHVNRHGANICSDGVWVFQDQVGLQGLAEELPCGEAGIHL